MEVDKEPREERSESEVGTRLTERNRELIPETR